MVQLLKSVAKSSLSSRRIGIPVAKVLNFIGAERMKQKVSKLCGYIPSVVEIEPPRHLQVQRFLLDSCGGREQISRAIWWHGWSRFESNVSEVFALLAVRSSYIIDVGANIGFYSLLAAKCSSTSLVHAFEPFPHARVCLKQNIMLNDLTRRIEIFPHAVAEGAGQAALFVPEQEHGVIETSCSLSESFRARHSAILHVPTVSLDNHVAHFPELAVDLVKIDVESQEHRVLKGAGRILEDHRPFVILEVLTKADVSALQGLSRRANYVPFLISEKGLERMKTVTAVEICTMQLLCPAEKLAELKDRLKARSSRRTSRR